MYKNVHGSESFERFFRLVIFMADLKPALTTAKSAFLLRNDKPLVPALSWTSTET